MLWFLSTRAQYHSDSRWKLQASFRSYLWRSLGVNPSRFCWLNTTQSDGEHKQRDRSGDILSNRRCSSVRRWRLAALGIGEGMASLRRAPRKWGARHMVLWRMRVNRAHRFLGQNHFWSVCRKQMGQRGCDKVRLWWRKRKKEVRSQLSGRTYELWTLIPGTWEANYNLKERNWIWWRTQNYFHGILKGKARKWQETSYYNHHGHRKWTCRLEWYL